MPVLALLLAGLGAFLLLVVGRKFRKKWLEQQEIRRRMAATIGRQRTLLNAKSADIDLLKSAWELTESEISRDRRLASGAYGEARSSPRTRTRSRGDTKCLCAVAWHVRASRKHTHAHT